jgi:hypothetical protein
MFKSFSISFPILSTMVAAQFLAACGGSIDTSASDDVEIARASDALRAPVLPSPTLAVPAGNKLRFFYDAVGVQIYGCSATATGFGWVFKFPEATLFDKHGLVAGTHYVGPTWESTDGSKVVGAKVAGFTADPTAIPELLLQAVSHTGDGRMSDVTYIQRLDTVGGLAPTSGCDAGHVGAEARVDYTATYFFYEVDEDDE